MNSSNTIYFSSKKAKRAQTILHFVAGSGLLSVGLSNLSSPEHASFAYVEIATGALLILGIILEKILPHAHVERFDWILDILAGSVAFVEGLSKTHGHFRAIVGAYWIAALMFFALAYFRPRLKRMRYARFEEESLVVRTFPFKKEVAILWKEIESITMNGKLVIKKKNSDTVELDLNDMENPSEVRRAFAEQRELRDIYPQSNL